MPPAPPLEMARQRTQQSRLARRLLLRGGAAEEACAQLRVPANGMPVTHLILEEPGEQEALRRGRFHHLAVVVRGGVDDELIEYRAQPREHRHAVGRGGRDQRVMCEDARVVQELVRLHRGVADVPQVHEKELERPTFVSGEKLAEH